MPKRPVSIECTSPFKLLIRFGYVNHICSFVLEPGLSEEYQLPYYDILPGDPCFEEVRSVVLTANKRPLVPSEWLKDEVRLVQRHIWQNQDR